VTIDEHDWLAIWHRTQDIVQALARLGKRLARHDDKRAPKRLGIADRNWLTQLASPLVILPGVQLWRLDVCRARVPRCGSEPLRNVPLAQQQGCRTSAGRHAKQ
jgi:hypothetical protein